MLWDGQPRAKKCEQCEKDGKAYIERVQGSEQDFEHVIKCEDMVDSQDSHALSLLH